MTSVAVFTLVDGVQVVAHDSLDLITPYVLREQQDWFEDEIRFVRQLLRPGNRVIDIGANHGVYSLCMAKAVGKRGRVWAFEPGTDVARLLERSIGLNRFDNISLQREAVSGRVGEAKFAVSIHSEHNTLGSVAVSSGATETVPLTTLDAGMAFHEWRDIDLLKIDAEGEEANILKGGKRFFAEMSPLVLYEIRAGADLQLDLVQSFAALGYRSYRLVPGLALLAPFDPLKKLDDFLLNLFACKPDRAALLAAQGRLVIGGDKDTDRPNEPIARPGPDDWRERIAELPYGRRFASLWQGTVARGHSGPVTEALALHARSQNLGHSAADRLAALQRSFELLRGACDEPSSYLRLASLARVAAELGERTVAYGALIGLSDTLMRRRDVGPAEPFLAPSARFDLIAPGDSVGNWVLAATLEERERLGSHSSYFAGDSSRDQLRKIQTLGFASEEMKRRLELVERRFGGIEAARSSAA